MRISAEVLYEVIPLFLRDGWQVVSHSDSFFEHQLHITQNVHAIGDRANGIVIDVFEASLKGVNVTASRPRLEHAQIITKDDRNRLGRLGGKRPVLVASDLQTDPFHQVIASVQPTHA